MKITRVIGSICAVAALSAGLLGCTPQVSADVVPETAPPASGETDPAVTFISVVDGDTIETSSGTVRIMGIDTPERGACGAEDASTAIASLMAGGEALSLELPAGQNDSDRYGRLIRYVTTSAGADVGLAQLEAGHAVARYDSQDGYPAHPREANYHAAQLASYGADGSVVTVACQVVAAAPPPAQTDRWWEQYTSCAKLKKNSVGHSIGPFNRDDPAQAEAYDWFAHRTGNNGDGEGDGVACE